MIIYMYTHTHYMITPHTQSYKMHLKSSNGPIDVLVCPEGEDQRSQSPFSSSSSDYNPAVPVLGPSSGLDDLTPTNTPPPPQQQQLQQQHSQPSDLGHHATPLTPHAQCMPPHQDINMTPQSRLSMVDHVVGRVSSPAVMECAAKDLDISLSSTADVNGDDLEGLMDSYNCDNLDNIDSSALLPAGMLSFESLSPPLQDEDFCFAMDGPEGIQDLFDLVS